MDKECCFCERILDENQKVYYLDKEIKGDFCNKLCLTEYLIGQYTELELDHIVDFIDSHMEDEEEDDD